MALVPGVGDGFEELAVAPRAADILRRAAPSGLDQAGISDARHGVIDTLDPDRVLPAVAEVVEVPERLRAGVFERVEEPSRAHVERPIAPVRIWNAPAHVAGADLLKMAVGPAEGGLQRQAQAVEPDGERHLDPAHHGRFDIVERDLEAGAIRPR